MSISERRIHALDNSRLRRQILAMKEAFQIDSLPELKDPLMIVGLEGWGNALEVSSGMASYMIRQLNARAFGKINSDLFYRYDEARPIVDILEGRLKGVVCPGGTLYAAPSESNRRDPVILKAKEPHIRWSYFTEEMLALCKRMGVRTIVTLGSMYDSVLHSDLVISGIAWSEEALAGLKERGILPINYQGPSAIHSIIQQEGQRQGIECISLWCHCPYYLQGTTHYGLLAALGSLLSSIGSFQLDTSQLEASWKELNSQIEALIEQNPELQGMVDELRKAKIRGSWADIRSAPRKDEKVIHLRDFLKPR